jgi:2,4-dienoyl-CoA reductase (NADPH2)
VTYEHLLSPGRLGALETRNRIVMAPMGSNLCEPDGTPGARMRAYYEARARGGAGLVIVEVAAIAWPAGAANPNQLGISRDDFVPPLARLVERIHAHGAKAALQLQHAGKVATRDIAAGRPMWVPSRPEPAPMDLFADLTHEQRDQALRDYFRPGAKAEYHEMSHDDIAQLREWFAAAVVRARDAGFDGVELHAGHGYVLSAFLSPHTNRRDDEYGGPLPNRARLLLETVRGVREAVGRDYPLWCRLDGAELDVDGGITLDDACATAKLAVDAGLDGVHVSAYADPGIGRQFTRAPLVHEPGGFVELARAVKHAIAPAPVIAVGRIAPDVGDRLIADGDADFVAMGRKLLADPELPNQLAHGHRDDARPCVYSYRCVGNVFLTRGARCTVNPSTGREHELPHELEPATVARRVMIVGGGPAGLESARIAAARGHSVVLFERNARLGGRAVLAAQVEPAIGELVAWLERQVARHGVDVRLGVDVGPRHVQECEPDVVIVATGAQVPTPDEWLAALLDANPPGPVTLFGGNGPAALLAAVLAERGATVTLASPHENFGVGLSPPRLWRVMDALRRHGVTLTANTPLEALGSDAVALEPWSATHEPQRFAGPVETHWVGDSRAAGLLDGAMLDAAHVAGSL